MISFRLFCWLLLFCSGLLLRPRSRLECSFFGRGTLVYCHCSLDCVRYGPWWLRMQNSLGSEIGKLCLYARERDTHSKREEVWNRWRNMHVEGAAVPANMFMWKQNIIHQLYKHILDEKRMFLFWIVTHVANTERFTIFRLWKKKKVMFDKCLNSVDDDKNTIS